VLQNFQRIYKGNGSPCASGLPHVFSRDTVRQERIHQCEVGNLKAKLSQKDEVIAKLLTEHITLKKRLG
jgi:hypothetical protein